MVSDLEHLRSRLSYLYEFSKNRVNLRMVAMVNSQPPLHQGRLVYNIILLIVLLVKKII